MSHALLIVLVVMYFLAIVGGSVSVGKPVEPSTPGAVTVRNLIYAGLIIWISFQW